MNTTKTYTIVIRETVIETYQIEAETREKAFDKIIIDQPKPISTKRETPPPIVTIQNEGDEVSLAGQPVKALGEMLRFGK